MPNEINQGTAVIFKSADQPLFMAHHPLPHPGPGEVLVEIAMTTLCSSDLLTISGKRQEPVPLILGHESIGRVCQLPTAPVYDLNGSPLQPGDSISWSVFSAPAGNEWAQSGMRQKHPDGIKYGHRQLSEHHFFSGGLASHCHLLPHTCIMKIPPEASPVSFCPVNCSLATVMGGFRVAGDIRNQKILITGGGMLGIYSIALARTRGAAHIVVSEPLKERHETCLAFGADEVYRPEELDDQASGRFDVTVDTSGQIRAMQQGIQSLSVGGIAVWLGAVFPQKALPLNTEMIVRNLITIQGLHNYNEVDFQHAVNFMIKHGRDFPFDSLVEQQFPLQKINEAISYAREHRPFRVAVVPGSA